MELTIATATSRYVFSAEDLARYPESLLSTAYESQLDASAGIVLDFDSFELPTNKFPHISREAAAGLVHGVYRDGKMGTVLNTLITHVESAQTTGSTSVYEMLHEELSKLLDYFHLPVAITSYLPPINTLDLQQRQLLSFTYTAHAIEQAHMVVGAMLSYKPHKAADQPWGAAAFLVSLTADTSNSHTLPVAKIYVLLSPPEHLLSSVMQKCDHHTFAFSYVDPCDWHDDGNVLRTRAAIMGEESDLAEAESVYSLQRRKLQFVSANDRWLGYQLLKALAEQPNDLKGGCCTVSSRLPAGSCDLYKFPIWVLMW